MHRERGVRKMMGMNSLVGEDQDLPFEMVKKQISPYRAGSWVRRDRGFLDVLSYG